MTEAVDLEAVKQTQQKVWSEGDFSMVGGTQLLADYVPALLERARERAAPKRFNRGGERAMLVDSDYLEVVAVRA